MIKGALSLGVNELICVSFLTVAIRVNRVATRRESRTSPGKFDRRARSVEKLYRNLHNLGRFPTVPFALRAAIRRAHLAAGEKVALLLTLSGQAKSG
jgi:hypothetical protein